MWQRLYDAVDERLKIKGLLQEFLAHRVPSHANPLKNPRAFVYCFGGITAAIAVIMLLTGIFLAVYYVPSPDHAYDSVEYIQTQVKLGWLVRGIHHWGGSAIVVMVIIHMLRVYLHGAYRKPRELNWMLGVGLLLIVLGLAFTGYLLPWHQRSYWATSVGTNMISLVPYIGEYLMRIIRGGTEVGAVTLVRFYAFHVGFLPLLGVILLLLHFLMVRRQGISRPL